MVPDRRPTMEVRLDRLAAVITRDQITERIAHVRTTVARNHLLLLLLPLMLPSLRVTPRCATRATRKKQLPITNPPPRIEAESLIAQRNPSDERAAAEFTVVVLLIIETRL